MARKSMLTRESLESAALRLDPMDRAWLVEKLIASLDADPEIENAWAKEVDRRVAGYESGGVALLPGVETLDRLKSSLK